MLAASTPSAFAQDPAGESGGVDRSTIPAAADARVSDLARLAQGGDPDAQHDLGTAFTLGRGVERDYPRAYYWYRRAADQGNSNAIFNLGVMNDNGWGVPRSPHDAFELYLEAATLDHPDAMQAVGLAYAGSYGVEGDTSEAAAWFTKAFENRMDRSAFYLGELYERGIDGPPDVIAAADWYWRAADRGVDGARAALDRLAGTEAWPDGTGVEEPGATLPTGEALVLHRSYTGFVVSDDGYVLTAAYVAEACGVLKIAGAMVARIEVDREIELALLRMRGPAPAHAVFAETAATLGEDVFMPGFPLGSDLFVAKGEVSALARANGDPKRLEATVLRQPGTSGGPLLGGSGNVIGIVDSGLGIRRIPTGPIIPLDFTVAIPATTAISFLAANGIDYRVAPSSEPLDVAAIERAAQDFTVRIECWGRE